MNRKHFKNWDEFRQELQGYSALPLERRQQLIFRGQASSRWPLQTTLDRFRHFKSDMERQEVREQLLDEFKRESAGLEALHLGYQADEWELLGRHHGLPSPILDWTRSPFIASYFAFAERAAKENRVAVWMLDREYFALNDVPGIEILNDDPSIRSNQRAIEQRAVFVRVDTIRKSVGTLLDPALTRMTIPARQQAKALADLDEMAVNARTLFRDLDGAARTAMMRLR